ncbi:MAG: YybS family protein [Clostridiales bacterium]|mgnify:CR=1 FL=1|nr:YybS family protein [Clostridiales bacterium]HBM82011.1 hypothetical protein [Clostridiaceae bacterium]
MNKINTKALVEASILIAIASIIIIMSIYVPFFMIVGYILWPIPITLLTFKYDIKMSLMSLFALFLIVSAFANPISAFSLILLYGIPAVILGICLRRKTSPFITVLSMAASMFISYIVTIKLSTLIFGIDVMKETYKMFDDGISGAREMLRGMQISEEQINVMIPKELNSSLLRMVLPGMLAVTSILGSFLNYYVVGIIFKRLKIKIDTLKPFNEWYVSNSLSYGLFFSMLVSFILVYLKVNNADIVFNSIYIIFQFAFIIDGFAVVYWFLRSRRIGKILSIFIMVMLLSLSMVIFYLGIIDFILDFRKINPSRKRRIYPGE